MSRIPIRIRLTGWFLLVMAVVLALLGVFVVERLRDHLIDEVDRSLTPTAQALAEAFTTEGLAVFVEDANEAVAVPGSRTFGAQIIGPGRRVIGWGGSSLLAEPLLANTTVAAARHESVRAGPAGTHLQSVAVGVTVEGVPSALVVAEPLAEVDAAVRRTTILLLVGGAVALLLAGFGAWHVAERAMRPVNRMTTRAAAIDVSDLDQRVPVPPATDELQALARTFNAMLERLQAGVAARERLIADTSHELRAPLAAMRAELDVSLRHDDLAPETRDVFVSLREEVARMARLVDNLLTLARIDEGTLELLPRPTDLHDLAARVVRAHAAHAGARQVTVDLAGDGAVAVCDPDRIGQVLANLLDNAIRHAPSGSTVTVRTATAGAAATVSVSDQGPGVPIDFRDRIFDRFARRDAARGRDGGAGLGLAISREIATAHGGDLTLDPAPPPGATFTLTLPVATPAPAPTPVPANA